MTRNWFTCVVKYVRPGVDGSEEKTTDQLLLDAYTYTEAEARLVGIVTDVCTGPFEVKSITKSNYAEVVRFDTGDKWFRVKVALTSFDERSGKEKQLFGQRCSHQSYAEHRPFAPVYGSVSSHAVSEMTISWECRAPTLKRDTPKSYA